VPIDHLPVEVPKLYVLLLGKIKGNWNYSQDMTCVLFLTCLDIYKPNHLGKCADFQLAGSAFTMSTKPNTKLLMFTRYHNNSGHEAVDIIKVNYKEHE
jgi:hypothetical protein